MKNNSIFGIWNDYVSSEKTDKIAAVIKSLYIKNYALIDELEVSFESGLNILTGQTGAGKSIIIGALNAVLGERADTETIREGARKAVVEAVIHTSPDLDPVVDKLFSDNDIDRNNGEIILRREIRPAGSRAFINDTPVTISLLRTAGDRLVDLHGQHDHQLLLKEDHHREVIDALPGVRDSKTTYLRAFETVRRLRREREYLRNREKELQEQSELNRYQLQELEAAELDGISYEDLESEMKRLDHAEELEQKAALIDELGSGDERNLLDMLSQIADTLGDMAEMESGFSTYLEEIRQARISIQELLSYVERYRSNIEFNPERLESLRRKQSEVRRLEKKYNRSLTELLEFRKELVENVDLAENFDLKLEKNQNELNKASAELEASAKSLHDARIKAGAELGKNISDTLTRLGIPHNRFESRITWRNEEDGWIRIGDLKIGCYSDGPDEVAFYICTNKGESPRPMARIASGGEVSRVMLAMKSVIAREQHLPVMIFDEIDNGVSGAIAERVGQTMHELAQNCQIIAITHQAQIASQADHHYKVEKQETGDRTITTITKLDDERHIVEIASIISGAEVSDHAVASARELVEKARNEYQSGKKFN